MRASSTPPLSRGQLDELDCHFNSKAARKVLRARGAPGRPLLRILNQQNAGSDQLADRAGIRTYEPALRLRNKTRAERTLPAERQKALQSRPTIADFLPRGEQPTPDIVSLTPTEYLALSQREVAQYQTGVAAWVMALSLQLTLLRRNTVKARTMLHHRMSGWGDFPGGRSGWEEQLRILNDGLLAQRTVYAAYREFGTLVV
jgi:hypothetical protein